MTALTIFEKKNLPAHIAAYYEQEGSNLPDKLTVPSLAYGGKTWTVTIDGDKKKLMKKDADGDEVPVSVVQLVVLDFNQRRGRAYYEGAYDPDNISQPACWSEDGFKPHSSVAEPKCKTCEKCPLAAKGSKVAENGKSVTACSQHRMLAVVPAYNLKNPELKPLRMKIAITSDWDKSNKEQQAKGWFAFQQLCDYLKQNGCQNTSSIVLKVKFDPSTDYPKLLFSPFRFLEADELVIAGKLAKSADTAKLLAGWTPAGADGERVDEDEAPPPKAKATKAPPPDEDDELPDLPPALDRRPKTAKAPPPDEDEDEEDFNTTPPPKTKKAKVVEVEDDDDAEVIPPSKAAPAADKAKPVKQGKPKTAKAAEDDEDEGDSDGGIPDDVAAIVGDWGDD